MRVSTLWWSRNTPPEARRRKSERDEDRSESGDEERGRDDRAPAIDGQAILQIGQVEPGDHRQVTGDERQDARREERDHTTAERGEVREEVHVADAGAQREERRRVAPGASGESRVGCGNDRKRATTSRSRRSCRRDHRCRERYRPGNCPAAGRGRRHDRRWRHRRSRRRSHRQRDQWQRRDGTGPPHRRDEAPDIDALVDAAQAEFGRVDIMGNVAGVPHNKMVAECTDEEFERILAINLKSVFYGCQAALRHMIPQGSGAIVNISSGAIDTPAPTLACYTMTKAAVAMLTKTLATEVGRHGIRVNAIAPGMILTNFSRHNFVDADGNVVPEKLEQYHKRGAPWRPSGAPARPKTLRAASSTSCRMRRRSSPARSNGRMVASPCPGSAGRQPRRTLMSDSTGRRRAIPRGSARRQRSVRRYASSPRAAAAGRCGARAGA